MFSNYIFVVLLIQIVSGQFSNYLFEDQKKVLKWCIISTAEEQKCQDFARAMKESNEFEVDLMCILRDNKHDCMKAIDTDKADIVTLDAGEVYIAGRYFSLAPIMSEIYSLGGSDGYYSVAVVRAESNITRLEDLRNRRICFSGVGHMAGWVVPIATLLEREVLNVIDCNNLVKTATDFFGPSCAPNALNDKYNPSGDNSLKLCQQCAGWNNGRGSLCSESDLYAGYEGAFKCMASGSGELAFLTHTTVQEMVDSRRGFSASNFKLLCVDGSLQPVDRYIECNWGRAPPHAVVTSSSVSFPERSKLQDLLLKAAKLFSKYGEEDVNENRFKKPSSSWASWSSFEKVTTRRPVTRKLENEDNSTLSKFKLFVSTPTYGNYTSLMFQDTAQGFKRVPESEQIFSLYLGKYTDVVEKLRWCPVTTMALCVTTEQALKKCYRMRIALAAQDLKPDLHCVLADSDRACMGTVKQGIADVTVLEAGDIYRAGHSFNLKPIIAEQYNLDEPVYYAVAVAQASDTDTDLLFLKGKKSCHTGIGTAAGWAVPIDFLTRNRLMRGYGCNSVRAASEFFQKSCAPGAFSGEFFGTSPLYSNLCHLCHGSSSSYCKRDGSEPFQGHTGALRCLVEGGGEIAFFKHTTISENVGGRNKLEWIRNMLADDFELLCRDGTRASVTDFRTCNLGTIASNAIVARASDPDHVINAYIGLFMYAQQYYGYGSNYGTSSFFSFPMFSSDKAHPDQIFQDATQLLQIVPKEKRNYKDYLGKEFVRVMESTDCTAGGSVISHSVLFNVFLLAVIKLFT